MKNLKTSLDALINCISYNNSKADEHFVGFGAFKSIIFYDFSKNYDAFISQKGINTNEYNDFFIYKEFFEQIDKLGLDKNLILSSIKQNLQTQFFTKSHIVKAIFDNISFDTNSTLNILDPSAGSGVFIDHALESFPNSNIIGIEKDYISFLFLKNKYSNNSNISIVHSGFEDFESNISFDIISSNIPFGNFKLYTKDADIKPYANSVTGLFYSKALKLLNHNGVCAFISQSSILHSDKYDLLRKHIASKAGIVSLIQLPNGTFDHTEINAIFLAFQKNIESPLNAKFTNSYSFKGIFKENHYSINFNNALLDNDNYFNSRVIGDNIVVTDRPYGRPNFWFHAYNNWGHDFSSIVALDFKNYFKYSIINVNNPRYNESITEVVPTISMPKKNIIQLDLFSSPENVGDNYDVELLLLNLGIDSHKYKNFKILATVNLHYFVDIQTSWDNEIVEFNSPSLAFISAYNYSDKKMVAAIVNLLDVSYPVFKNDLFKFNQFFNATSWSQAIDVLINQHFDFLKNKYNFSDLNFKFKNLLFENNAAIFDIAYHHVFNDFWNININDISFNNAIENSQQEFISLSHVNNSVQDPIVQFILEHSHLKSLSVFLYNNNIYQISSSDNIVYSKLDLKKIAESKFKDYLHLKNTYYNLIDSPSLDLQNHLNKSYDYFINKHGYLNDLSNKKLFLLDSNAKDILSLEFPFSNTFKKSNIFFKNFDHTDVLNHVISIQDAFNWSLNTFGKLDISYVAQLSNNSVQDATKKLYDLDLVYFNVSTNQFDTKQSILSGNIYDLIDSANQFISNSTNDDQINFALKTLNLLKNNIPETITFDHIPINLGESWLPIHYYEKFILCLFGSNDLNFKIELFSNSFVANKSFIGHSNSFSVKSSYSNRSYSGMDLLLRFAFNQVFPQFTYTVTNADGSTTRMNDYVAENEAKQIINSFKMQFLDFILNLSDNDKNTIQKLYNYKFNHFAVEKNNYQSPFQFNDLNWKNAKEFLNINSIHDIQANAAWKSYSQNGGLIDWEVGLGKTLVICIAAHERARLNRIHNVKEKNLVICLGANIVDIANTYNLLFPQDHILFPGKDDFSKKNLEVFLYQLKNNDFDTVFLTKDQFARIPYNDDIHKEFIENEISDLNNSIRLAKDFNLSKREENALNNSLNNKLAQLSTLVEAINSKKFDDNLTFDQFNFGHIFIDESHYFKNLAFSTVHKRVKGIGNTDGSLRANNLLMAIRTLQKKNNSDLCATFFSGTPITNSLTEMYLLFKYLIPSKLQELQIDHFDSFANTFCQKTKDFEFNAAGVIKADVERFSKFTKCDVLANLYASFTDFKTADSINLIRPSANYIEEIIKPDDITKYFQSNLKSFYISGFCDLGFTPTHKNSQMIEAVNLARKLALHPQLFHSSGQNSKINKISVCADRVFNEYLNSNEFKGTQIVFCDISTPNSKASFNAYQELKNLLLDKGVPDNDIQFIHDFDSDSKRKTLFDLMNRGEVRILLGSSDKAGTGLNVQKRIIALHHLDFPYTPHLLTQREGRGIRQGNEMALLHRNNIVNIYKYGIEGSVDIFLNNLLLKKDAFIKQIRNNSVMNHSFNDDLDNDGTISQEQFIAQLSGNPLFLEKASLEKNIAQLELDLATVKRKILSISNDEKNLKDKLSLFSSNLDRFSNLLSYFNSFVSYNDENKCINNLVLVNDSSNFNFNDFKVTEFGALFHDKISVFKNNDNVFYNLGFFYHIKVGILDQHVGFKDYNDSFYPIDINLNSHVSLAKIFSDFVDSLPKKIDLLQQSLILYSSKINDLGNIHELENKKIDISNDLYSLKNNLASVESSLRLIDNNDNNDINIKR